MRANAYGKINLSLNVVERKTNGYHEMDMIMIPIPLHDTLNIAFADEDIVVCENQELVLDESNTIMKAIKLMKKTFDIKDSFKIMLTKRIPMQAGLAGGSSDAATTLCLINELCELKQTNEVLASLGAQIGADVPFCVYSRCARVKGIGEKLDFFTFEPFFHLLLVKPKQGVSTKEAFASLDSSTCVHPDAMMVKQALIYQDYQAFLASIDNSLEAVACEMVPEINVIKKRLIEEGFDLALMSGSGSTVFGISQNKKLIEKVWELLKNEYEMVEKIINSEEM